MTKIERGRITWIQILSFGIFVKLKTHLLLCALDLSSAIKTGDSDSRFLWQYIGTIFSPLLRLTGGGWDMGQRRWMRWMRMRWMSWMRQGAEHQAQVTLGVSRSITSQPNASQEVYVCQPTVQPSCIKTSHKSVCEQSYKMKYVKVSKHHWSRIARRQLQERWCSEPHLTKLVSKVGFTISTPSRGGWWRLTLDPADVYYTQVQRILYSHPSIPSIIYSHLPPSIPAGAMDESLPEGRGSDTSLELWTFAGIWESEV